MVESHAMTGGDGPSSYVRNSDMQKRAADFAKDLLVEQIVENLELGNAAPSVFTIADMGCSTGPNTFSAVENIIEAVTEKYGIVGQSKHLPEFQVFFNDRFSNDFNTLFAYLPSDKKYYAAGVPGSFHGRLFPKASLNVVYSATALHWLSETPQEIGALGSPACNRGRIFYDNAPKEIVEAYLAKFAEDMESFLRARAEEVTAGGLMVILMIGCPSGTLPSRCSPGPAIRPLESCLIDMANEGIISNDKVDTFNMPVYGPSIDELTTLIQNNGSFSILRMEMLNNPSNGLSLLSTEVCRASFENLIRGHFGDEIIEQLFQRYTIKIVGHPLPKASETTAPMFVLLKRKA